MPHQRLLRIPTFQDALPQTVVSGGIFLIAAFFCSSAAAGVFANLDTNSDGVLSGNEVTGLTVLDADKDGEVSEGEFRQRLDSHQEFMLKMDNETFVWLDKNEDQRLSGTESTGWEFCDSNDDRKVSLEEYEQGLRDRRSAHQTTGFAEMKKLLDKDFRSQDQNKDGRLSGTEIYWVKHYDLNGDSRVTLEEFVTGHILDSAAVTDQSDSTDSTETPDPAAAMQQLAEFLNESNTDGFYSVMRQDLQAAVDPVVLNVLLKIVAESHGQVKAPIESDIKVIQNDDDENISYQAVLDGEKEDLTGRLTFAGAELTGFELNSPPIDQFNDRLFSDISEDEDVASSIGEFYSGDCRKMIDLILEGNNDDAFAMFHPEVQQQLTRSDVDDLFKLIRDHIGKVDSMEYAGIRAVYDDKGKGDAIRVYTRLSGSAGELMIHNKFQFTGMKGVLVGIYATSDLSISDPDNDSSAPATLPPGAEEADEWKMVNVPERGFRFWMPGTPEKTIDDDQMVSWILDHEPSGTRFVVQSFPDQEGVGAELDTFFSTLRKELATNTKGKILKTEDAGWNGKPGKRLALKMGDGRILVRRDIVIGDRVFALQWVSADLSKAAEKRFCDPFLASFGTPVAETEPEVEVPVPESHPVPPQESSADSSAITESTDPVNMAWLPSQTEIIVSARPAELVNSEFLKPLAINPISQILLSQMKERAGLSLTEIESVTIGLSNVVPLLAQIGMQTQGMTDQTKQSETVVRTLLSGPYLMTVVRLQEDFELSGLLEKAGAVEATHGDRTYSVVNVFDDMQLGVWQAAPGVILAGSPQALHAAMDDGEGETNREAFAFTVAQNDLTVAAASPLLAGFSAGIPAIEGTPPEVIVRLMDSVRGRIAAAGLTVESSTGLEVSLTVQLNEESAAAETAALASEGLELVRSGSAEIIGTAPEPLRPSIEEALNTLKAEVISSNVPGHSAVRISLEIPQSLVDVLSQHPELLNPREQPESEDTPDGESP